MKKYYYTWLAVLMGLFGIVLPGAWATEGDELDSRLQKNYEIIFDTSGSMAGQKLQVAKESLKQFCDKIPSDAQVGLIVFESGKAKELLPLGNHNRNKLLQTIDNMKAVGNTPIKHAIELATKNLTQRRQKQFGYGDFIVLLVTDGEETVDPKGLPSVVQHTTQEGFVLDVIGFDLGQDHSLKAYATKYRSAGNQQELDQAFSDVLAESERFEEVKAFTKE